MYSNLSLTVNDSEIMNELNIDIGKINVVGGINGSGKTTVAKVLYCFLKVLSEKKDQYLHKEFVREVNNFNRILNYSQIEYFKQDFQNEDSYIRVLNEFLRAKNFFFEHELEKTHFPPDMAYDEGYELVFGKIDSLTHSIEGKKQNLNFEILDSLMDDEALWVFKDSGVIFKSDSFKFISNNPNDSYFDNNLIPDAFYMDTLSILDLKGNHIMFKEHIRHLKETLDEEPDWWNKETIAKCGGVGRVMEDASIALSPKNREVYLKIENMIEGQYRNYDVEFGFKKRSSDEVSFTNTTPSGIKQIGVIQILLLNGKLKNGSFLIIDEPEVNLHPEWQFKFAEILVLLAKELDITVYLNSHSPMFIEAMEVLTKYYDLEDETNFYLTEKADNDKYDFVKIDYENLYDLYDNLAKPFDAIEMYRLKAEYKKGNY